MVTLLNAHKSHMYIYVHLGYIYKAIKFNKMVKAQQIF